MVLLGTQAPAVRPRVVTAAVCTRLTGPDARRRPKVRIMRKLAHNGANRRCQSPLPPVACRALSRTYPYVRK